MPALAVSALALSALFSPGKPAIQSQAPKPIQVALMCFKSGERVSGLNKICYYDCAGSEAAITIKNYELCPLSIDR